MAEQIGKFLTELPELTTPIEDDLMYIVDDDTSKRITLKNLRSVVGGEDVTGTASGAVATFIDGGDDKPMKSLVVDIEATQSGSGTPSPSNIRPISGHTDVTVTVASTSGGSGDDTTVSLGRTVYGGTLDVTTGVLTVTHGGVDLGSLSWSLIGSGNSERFQTNGLTDNLLPPNNSTPFSGLCEIYEVARWDYLESAGHDIFICNNSTAHWVAVRDTNYTSATDFTNSVNGKYLVYELATPQTFNLTPTQVKTLLGQNYVSHDGGGNIKVVYIRDLDIVINDLIDRVTALENE